MLARRQNYTGGMPGVQGGDMRGQGPRLMDDGGPGGPGPGTGPGPGPQPPPPPPAPASPPQPPPGPGPLPPQPPAPGSSPGPIPQPFEPGAPPAPVTVAPPLPPALPPVGGQGDPWTEPGGGFGLMDSQQGVPGTSDKSPMSDYEMHGSPTDQMLADFLGQRGQFPGTLHPDGNPFNVPHDRTLIDIIADWILPGQGGGTPNPQPGPAPGPRP